MSWRTVIVATTALHHLPTHIQKKKITSKQVTWSLTQQINQLF